MKQEMLVVELGRTSFPPLGTHCISYNDKGAPENFKYNSKINFLMFTFFPSLVTVGRMDLKEIRKETGN